MPAQVVDHCERGTEEQEFYRNQAYLAEAQRLSHTGSFGWCLRTGELIWSSETYCIMGFDRSVKPTLDLVFKRVHPADAGLVEQFIKQATRDASEFDFEHRLLMPDGSVKHVHVMARPSRRASGEVEFVGAVMDVTRRKRTEALIAGEKRVLEMIARGGELASVLDAVCRFGEEICGSVLVSILLVGPDGTSLRHGAAPSLPQSYTEAIDGGLIGPCAGSCGTAAYRRAQVIVSDIATDPLWENYRGLAMRHGLRACWSTPIFSATREVIGTFALYSHEARDPSPEQLNLIEQMTHLAAVAIDRKRTADTIRASEQLAQGQLKGLKNTLDALAKEAVPDRLVEHVLSTVTEQLGAHSCSVWQRDDTTGLVAFRFAFEDGRFVTRSDSVLAGISLTLPMEDFWPWPHVFRTGKPALMEDIRELPFFPWQQRLISLGVITILIVPMSIAGRVDSVMGIRSTQKRAFTADELELAQALANQATLAMQLMRLSQQSREAAIVGERNRLARDIHDTLAQGFTGVIMQLEAAEGAIMQNNVSEARNRIERAGDLARVGLAEARRSVLALRPRSLEDASLCMALDDLLRRMTDGSSLDAKFHFEGDKPAMPPDWEEGLLRIAQESLTNTIKHAKARNFSATLTVWGGDVQFRLVDDGAGFDLGAEREGFGLLGMKERVDQMGGEFMLRSMPGQGTEIQVVLKNANGRTPGNGGELA